jgi:hypothetical protein
MKPTPPRIYQKKTVLDSHGYVHQPSYQNNNDLAEYEIGQEENEDIRNLM